MNTTVPAVFVALVLVAAGAWAAEDKSTEQENRLLTLALKLSNPEGGYTVVSPKAGSPQMGSRDIQQIEEDKKWISANFERYGVGVAKLVDRLFERNKKAVRLSFKSSPKDGYVIEGYFEEGGSWGKWHQDHPGARGFTTVSLPVYDEGSGLVLLYMGISTEGLAGSGWIILYKYEKGELKELNRVKRWQA